jgi:hypothetical protein
MSLPRKVLEKYIKGGCTFIETGSRWGDTLIRAWETGGMYGAFGCEVDSLMAAIAQLHVADVSGKISVEHAESTDWLRGFVTREANAGSVVFLDAHTETHSPVLGELKVVNTWKAKPYAILIDDIRCMEGWGVDPMDLFVTLQDMGYKVSYEDGVEPNDIMVGTLA